MNLRSIDGVNYTIGKKIGSGSYGNVYEAFDDNGRKFAVKKYESSDTYFDVGVLREISIFQIVKGNKHNVMDLQDIIVHRVKNKKCQIYTVMKKYETNLYDELEKGTLTKKDRRNIAFKLLESVLFLHKNGIIHRDIKLENILLDSHKNPVLTDFTLSKVLDGPCHKGTHTKKIATPTYRAPEVVLKKGYGFPADAWSVGVVLYELYSGKELEMSNDKEAIDFLRNESYKFRKNSLGRMIRGLLVHNPEKRWTIEKALQSDMFSYFPKIEQIWQPTHENNFKNMKVKNIIKLLCKTYGTKKKITEYAAQIFHDKTKCSTNNAVYLASKFYEADLYEIDNDNFAEVELFVFSSLNFNLYI